MKGPWIRSARHVKIQGDTLECELRTKKGGWVKNQIRFFSKYDYTNTDGKFEWCTCSNGVTLNSVTHDSILRRYRPVSIQRCLENKTAIVDDWFIIDKKFINCTADQCISISLFKKNANNTYPDQYKVDEGNWFTKYYEYLIFNLNNYSNDGICVNLYLASDLTEYIPSLQKYKFLNIFLMKSASIGATPGTLWRFMDISNRSYKAVYVLDIDDDWRSCPVLQYPVRKNEHKICTMTPRDGLICRDPYIPAYNFATILAGEIKANPSKFNYDIVEVMKGFIGLCSKRALSSNPYGFQDDDPITFWNQPVGDHKLGWGKIIPKYGFDELFLKHVIYYDAYPDVNFL
jgi:hypothetical protein